MRVVKIVLMVIGGFSVMAALLWFLAGYEPDAREPEHQPGAVVPASLAEMPRRHCDPEQTFHLERLRANKSLKVLALGENGIANVQRFLNLTMQSPVEISAIPRVQVWIAWQYNTQSFEGSLPAQGVIDVVQDDCVLYRRASDAAEIIAIANGEWSR